MTSLSLQWKENRVTYQNLKKETSLNALTDDDIKTITYIAGFYVFR